MGQRTNPLSVNRRGLVQRYADLRGVTYERANQLTRDWPRSDLREVIERAETEERPYRGRRLKSTEQTTRIGGYVTMVAGITR